MTDDTSGTVPKWLRLLITALVIVETSWIAYRWSIKVGHNGSPVSLLAGISLGVAILAVRWAIQGFRSE